MKQLSTMYAFMVLLLLVSCRPGARSERSFDEILQMAVGKSAAEIERMLGKPDSRQRMLLSGERWIWWNYTYLDGNNYPPEERGRVVHLEIIFERDAEPRDGSNPSPAQLRATDPLDITYTLAAGHS